MNFWFFDLTIVLPPPELHCVWRNLEKPQSGHISVGKDPIVKIKALFSFNFKSCWNKVPLFSRLDAYQPRYGRFVDFQGFLIHSGVSRLKCRGKTKINLWISLSLRSVYKTVNRYGVMKEKSYCKPGGPTPPPPRESAHAMLNTFVQGTAWLVQSFEKERCACTCKLECMFPNFKTWLQVPYTLPEAGIYVYTDMKLISISCPAHMAALQRG